MKYKCQCGNVIELIMWSAWDWVTITSDKVENNGKVEKEDSAYAKCDKCKTITHIYLKAQYSVSGSIYNKEEQD